MTREDILRVAEDKFGSNGYAATTLKQIADELGVFTASIHYHFPTKDSLMDEVLKEGFGSEIAYFEKISTYDAPPEVLLYRLLYQDVLDVSGRNLNMQRIFLLPELRDGRFSQVKVFWDKMCTVYQRLYKRGVKAGAFHPMPDRLVAEHFFNFSTTILVSMEPDALGSAKVQARTAADMALRSILTDTGRLNEIREQADKLGKVLAVSEG